MTDETSREYLDQLGLQIGRAIISFTQLEHSLTMLIARIFSLTEIQERALVRPMSITNKCSLLRLVTNQKVKPANRKEIKDWLDRIRDAADTRNDLAHGFYGHKNGKAAILSFSGANRFSGKPTQWTPRELGLFVFEIHDIRDQIDRVEAHFPTLK